MEKKKGFSLPIKVIIIGCIIGLIIAGIGVFKQIDSKRINSERKAAALKRSKTAVKAANERLTELGKEYDELKKQYDAKETECDSITTESDDWFARKNKCSREKSELQSKLWALEEENEAIKSKDYTGYYELVKPMSYQIFYIIGASVAGVAALGAFIIYLVKGKKTY